jgi:oxygen-independent coproporphyrinogen-3 oxidase
MKMLRFDLQRPELEYYFHELYQAFDPGVKNILTGEADGILSQADEDNEVVLSLSWNGRKSLVRRYQLKNLKEPLDNKVYKGFLYDFLCEYFNRELQWGTLTGIKPVKMIQKYHKNGWKYPEIRDRFTTFYRVSGDRTNLLIDIAKRQQSYIDKKKEIEGEKWVSLYVGIPLCPSKCDYCSFVSTIVDRKSENLNQYFNNLIIEIRQTGDFLRSSDICVDTLYIGGGTPTVLSAGQLDELMKTLNESFDLSQLREFTLEAGRSETISKEKLEVAKSHGARRICLNPQSMNSRTLSVVRRPWQEGLIEEQVSLIKSMGFNTLNMDLIVGLGDETPEDFINSLESVLALKPENITIHNLSIKKGSRIKERSGISVHAGYGEDFYQLVKKRLTDTDFHQYYLYRLKYTMGNSENIGYAKPGHDGIYNILMMAESQTTIGLGAGATGNLYNPVTDNIQKIFTVKDIKTYNERFNEIMKKKLESYRLLKNIEHLKDS